MKRILYTSFDVHLKIRETEVLAMTGAAVMLYNTNGLFLCSKPPYEMHWI